MPRNRFLGCIVLGGVFSGKRGGGMARSVTGHALLFAGNVASRSVHDPVACKTLQYAAHVLIALDNRIAVTALLCLCC